MNITYACILFIQNLDLHTETLLASHLSVFNKSFILTCCNKQHRRTREVRLSASVMEILFMWYIPACFMDTCDSHFSEYSCLKSKEKFCWSWGRDSDTCVHVSACHLSSVNADVHCRMKVKVWNCYYHCHKIQKKEYCCIFHQNHK